MKKILTVLILSYLLITINSASKAQDQNNLENKRILKVGVLLPLSGKYKDIGESFLKAIQLGIYDISNENIIIYPQDSKANAFDSYLAAKKFEDQNIKIVIGPVFYESLERLNEVNNVTFISLTNITQKIPNNVIAFGINIESQARALQNYFNKIKISKTLLLSPKSEFTDQSKFVANVDYLNFYKHYMYDVNPKKITGEIEKITKYRDRKKDLERRIKILEKSDLYKDKQELKKLEQMHTLGKVSFDSAVIIDFSERLKSVLTSFTFVDVPSDEVRFFTINQWFDQSFFNESAMQNLHFPSIDLKNFKKFNKKFLRKFGETPKEISILAYDALGLIYYCWVSNNFQFKKEQLYNKKGFKGLHGKFLIEKNISKQELKMYKVNDKKFIKVF